MEDPPRDLSLSELLRPTRRWLFQARPRISLELAVSAGEIRFQLWIPDGERSFVESQLSAAYPSVELVAVGARASPCASVGIADVRLAHGSYLPIRTTFDREPLANVLWALARVRGDHEVTLHLLIRPKSWRWQVYARSEAQRLRDGRRGWDALVPGTPSQITPYQFEKARAKAIEEKASRVGFDCIIRVRAAADQPATVREYVRAMGATVMTYSGPNSLRVGASKES